MEGNGSGEIDMFDSNVMSNGNDRMQIPYTQDRKFVCIEYPGMVQNTDKALASLGGIEAIAKTVTNPSKKLELKMRPADTYCKSIFGRRTATTNLLMKVKRRRKKTNGAESSSGGNNEQITAEILGTVESTYTYKTMADFQYLPMQKKDDGTYESLEDKIVIKKFTPLKDWLKQTDAPLFIPPVAFSRFDVPCEYIFRPPPVRRDKTVTLPVDLQPPNLIGTARNKRTVFTIFVNFDDKDIPSKPLDGAEVELRKRMKQTERETQVRALFEKRPIWSKNAIVHHVSGIQKDKLKLILPLVAYYMCTGPWRSLWVRLGYDPRTDPTAKIYQMLDFRVRHQAGTEQLPIARKRSVFNYNLPNTLNRSQAEPAKIALSELGHDRDPLQLDARSLERDLKWAESRFVYRTDMLPPYRCMFYQLCDIMEDECQKLIHQNDGKENKCTERDGWCIPDIGAQCRTIMFGNLSKLALREGQQPPDDETEAWEEKQSDNESEKDYGEDEPMEGEFAFEDETNEMETEMLDAV